MLQGSKLSPMLYIIYANDIADLFNFANIKMYADDLTIYACINYEIDRDKLQNELNNFYNWCLVINFQNCKLCILDIIIKISIIWVLKF